MTPTIIRWNWNGKQQKNLSKKNIHEEEKSIQNVIASIHIISFIFSGIGGYNL